MRGRFVRRGGRTGYQARAKRYGNRIGFGSGNCAGLKRFLRKSVHFAQAGDQAGLCGTGTGQGLFDLDSSFRRQGIVDIERHGFVVEVLVPVLALVPCIQARENVL